MMVGPPNRMLQLGVGVALIAYLYTLYNRNKTQDSFSVEQGMSEAWGKIIQSPSLQFKRIVVGINCNVDLIVSGTELLSRMNATPTEGVNHDSVNSLEDLEGTFSHFFSRGAAAERYTANGDVFNVAVRIADKELTDTEYSIGGNAALMAQKLAASYMNAKILLVGPIGPRLKALLHPQILTQNFTKIAKDEIHLSLEYKAGEIWGDKVAPSSSRFITSHDVFSGSSVVIDMFFNTIATFKPDLVVLSGVHLLEFQPKELWQDKLRLIKRNLGQLNLNIPIHLEIGSMADEEYARNVLHRIVPYVDSVGLNEQELCFLSRVGGGPYFDKFPAAAGAMHVYKAIEILSWLLENFGRDTSDPTKKQAGYRLERIHFHCLTYHVMVSRGPSWSNLAAGLAAGVRIAGRQACGIHEGDGTGLMELRTGLSILLDKEQGRVFRFSPHNPVTSWMKGDILYIFSPALVCKHPIKTVGLGDAISATGLTYSQFYRFTEKRV